MTAKSRFFLVWPLFLVLVFGCGKTTTTPAKLSGTVKYNGNPIPAGEVTLYGKDGGLYTLPINPDGTYSGSNLPSGEVEVSIDTESANTKGRPSPAQYGGPRAKGGGMSPPPPDAPQAPAGGGGAYVKIPAKYRSKETSGFTVTLKAGDNKQDFELTP